MRKPEEKPMNEIKNNNDSNKIKIQDNRRMLRIVLPLILALISTTLPRAQSALPSGCRILKRIIASSWNGFCNAFFPMKTPGAHA